MKQRRHAGRGNEARKSTQVLIGDLSRIIDILNVDIASSEQEAGVTDLARSEYPASARMLRLRRDNLMETIFALRQRLVRPFELENPR